MNAISRFPVPELDALPEDIRTRIVAVHQKAGFIPNVFLAWAHRPDEFRAFFALQPNAEFYMMGRVPGNK